MLIVITLMLAPAPGAPAPGFEEPVPGAAGEPAPEEPEPAPIVPLVLGVGMAPDGETTVGRLPAPVEPGQLAAGTSGPQEVMVISTVSVKVLWAKAEVARARRATAARILMLVLVKGVRRFG